MTDRELSMIRALAAIDDALGMPQDGCNSTAKTLTAIKLLTEVIEDNRRCIKKLEDTINFTPQPIIAPVQQDAEQKTFSMYGSPDLQQIILKKLKEKFDAEQPAIAPEKLVATVRAKSDAYGGTFVMWETLPVAGMKLYAAPQPIIAPALSLTHEMIDTAYRKVWSTVTNKERLAAFAYEIEAAIKSAHGITGDKQ